MTESANTRQVGGSHYASELQHWDWSAANFGPGYFKGQITKYVSRARKKNGVEDYKKAHHFLQKMIEIDWLRLNWVIGQKMAISAADYVDANPDITPEEQEVIYHIGMANDKRRLEYTLRLLEEMIQDYESRT